VSTRAHRRRSSTEAVSPCPHKVGKYSITFKDDLLLISEGQSVVAFFRAPHVISTMGTVGERIGVGCKNGEVLQLRAHWLLSPYETENMFAFIF
jgi:hypothetical protein